MPSIVYGNDENFLADYKDFTAEIESDYIPIDFYNSDDYQKLKKALLKLNQTEIGYLYRYFNSKTISNYPSKKLYSNVIEYLNNKNPVFMQELKQSNFKQSLSPTKQDLMHHLDQFKKSYGVNESKENQVDHLLNLIVTIYLL